MYLCALIVKSIHPCDQTFSLTFFDTLTSFFSRFLFIKYTYNGASQGCSLVLLVPPFIVVIKLSSPAERCFYWGSVLLIVIMTKLRVGLLVEFLSLLL